MGFLMPGGTTREDVVAELGDPPVVRRGGRFVAYAATRETAARMLALSIIPATFAFEESHFLFLEYDENGVLSRDELVISPTDTTTVPACDSLGYCVLWIDWEVAGLFPLWMSNGDVRHGELALLSDSSANEAAARRMDPPASGCTVYFYASDRKTTRSDDLLARFPGTVYFSLDEHPRYTDHLPNQVFAVWHVSPGSHTVRATRRDGGLVDEFPIGCLDGSVHALHAEVLPTFAGWDPAVRFEEVPPDWALGAIGDRRLLLE